MRRLLWVAGLVLLLAACGGDSETAPTVTPSRTPFEPTPLPPTWTASPPGFVPSPTVTAEPDESATETSDQPADAPSGQVQGGQQLPPTWTPGAAVGRPTVTPRPALFSSSGGEQGSGSSNMPAGSPAPTWTPQPDYCYTLAPLGGDVRVYVGDSVTLSWQPIPQFENYLVQIWHPGGSVVHSAIAPGGTYTVPGDVFTQANVYGWEVSAVDENGNRVCFSISGEIFTSFP
jgi:hypothetical protein